MGYLPQQLIHIIAQPAKLRCGRDAAGDVAAAVDAQRQIVRLRQRVMLHGGQHRRLRQQQPGALQRLFPLP